MCEVPDEEHGTVLRLRVRRVTPLHRRGSRRVVPLHRAGLGVGRMVAGAAPVQDGEGGRGRGRRGGRGVGVAVGYRGRVGRPGGEATGWTERDQLLIKASLLAVILVSVKLRLQ